jgi:putative colanic acid biosynthesis acetyltransferase WcaF
MEIAAPTAGKDSGLQECQYGSGSADMQPGRSSGINSLETEISSSSGADDGVQLGEYRPQWQDLAKHKLPSGFRGRPAWVVQLWWITQSTLFGCSPQFLYGWRRFLLRLFGAKIGQNVLLRPTIRVTFPWKVKIADHVWIGDNAVLYSLGPIEIGENAVISQRSYLCTGSHDAESLEFTIFTKPIRIEREAWVAMDVFVAPGVTIGAGAVIGARSSVFYDIPAGMVALGCPARVVRARAKKHHLRDEI